MGRATITGALGEGLYSATVNMDRARIAAELGWIASDLAELEPQLEEAQEQFDLRLLEYEEAMMFLSEIVSQYIAGDDLDGNSDCSTSTAGLVSAHNSLRAADGIAPLTQNDALDRAAQGHADWLARNDTGGHTGANRSTPAVRIYAEGYIGSPVSENVATGFDSVSGAMDGWIASPGHYATIMNPLFKNIGVGYQCRPDGVRRHLWVVTFGG